MAAGDFVGHQEPDVVARVAVLTPGVPETDNQLHVSIFDFQSAK
jgi:hypothetical protein